MIRSVITILILLIISTAHAQKDSNDISMDILGIEDFKPGVNKNKTTVTAASRTVRNSEELPYTVYIITQEEIQAKHYLTLVDVLKDIPGVKVSQPGSAQHGETFQLRGQFGNYYTKILIDNVPIQPSAAGGMPISAQFPLKNIDRIEVIAGPIADLYGADAMAGVINIVTKSSNKLKWGYADFEFGYPFYTNFNFSIGGKTRLGKRIFEYSIYGGALERSHKNIVEGYENVYDPQNFVLNGDSSYLNSDYYKGDYNNPEINNLADQAIYGGLRLKGKYLTFGVDYMSRKEHAAIGLNPLYRAYHDPNDFIGEQIIRVYGHYRREFGKMTSETNLSYLNYAYNPNSSYTTVQNPLALEGEFYSFAASDDIYLEQLFNFKANQDFNLLVGATFQVSGNFPTFTYFDSPVDPVTYTPFSNSLSENDYPFFDLIDFAPYNFINTSVLGQGYWDKNRWQIIAGVRLDYHSQFGSSINSKLAVLYKTSKTANFRASVGRAFRPPTAYHIFSGNNIYNGAISTPTPNWDLKAERNFSIELGYRKKWKNNHSFDVHGFFLNTNNFIYKSFIIYDTYTYNGFLNDESSNNAIIGLVLEHEVSQLFHKWKAYSRSSIQLITGEETLPQNRGTLNRIREVPQMVFKWNFGFSTGNLKVRVINTVMSNWISSSTFDPRLTETFTNDGFYNLDLQFDYPLNENSAIYFIMQNVTNATYGGIGVSGGFGPGQSDLILEDLMLNPQRRTNWRLGARINF